MDCGKISKIHNVAMSFADMADRHQVKEISKNHYRRAFYLEKKAALEAIKANIGQPTVSILLVSAISLGVFAEEYKKTEELIKLSQSIPMSLEYKEVLNNILKKLHSDIYYVTESD